MSTLQAEPAVPESSARRAHLRTLGLISLFIFTALYFIAAIHAARKSPWQTDEVFVLWMVRDVPAHQLASAVSHGLEWLPPTYYLYLKVLSRWAGPSPLALRLPSILAFYVTVLAIFQLLRKRFGTPIAAFAASLPCLTELGSAATLARPYTIMTACAALSLLLWVDLDKNRLSWLRAGGIAALLAFAISVHFTSVFYLFAFGLLELLYALQTRTLRWPAWSAFILAGASLFPFWPVIVATRRTTVSSAASAGFYARPSVARLFESLSGMLTTPLLILFVWIFLWIVAARLLRPPATYATMSPALEPVEASRSRRVDLAAAVCLLYPLIVFFAAATLTHVFNGRYTCLCVVGLSILVALGMRRLPGAGILCAQLTLVVGALFFAFSLAPSGPDARVQLMNAATDPIPVLASEATDFFELQEAAPPSLRQRLYYAQMPAGVPNNDFDPERIAIAWQAFRPLQVVHAESFFDRYPHFYLLYPSTDRERIGSWILERSTTTYVAHAGRYYLLEVRNLRAGR